MQEFTKTFKRDITVTINLVFELMAAAGIMKKFFQLLFDSGVEDKVLISQSDIEKLGKGPQSF